MSDKVKRIQAQLQQLLALTEYAMTQKNPHEALVKEFEKNKLAIPVLPTELMQQLHALGQLSFENIPHPAWMLHLMGDLYSVASAPSFRAVAAIKAAKKGNEVTP